MILIYKQYITNIMYKYSTEATTGELARPNERDNPRLPFDVWRAEPGRVTCLTKKSVIYSVNNTLYRLVLSRNLPARGRHVSPSPSSLIDCFIGCHCLCITF